MTRKLSTQLRQLDLPEHRNLYASLQEASREGDTSAVRLFLALGVGPDPPVFHNAAALLCAVDNERMAVVKLLLEYGANVEAGSDERFTPLMAAARNGDLQMVRLLLARGARPERTDYDGKTAIIYAQEGLERHPSRLCAYGHERQVTDYQEIIDILRKAGGHE